MKQFGIFNHIFSLYYKNLTVFDIEIPDDEAEKIQTVADVVAYIESK